MRRKHRMIVEITTYKPTTEQSAAYILRDVLENMNSQLPQFHPFSNLQKIGPVKQYSKVTRGIKASERRARIKAHEVK